MMIHPHKEGSESVQGSGLHLWHQYKEKNKGELQTTLGDIDGYGGLTVGQTQATCLTCIILLNFGNIHMRSDRLENPGSGR